MANFVRHCLGCNAVWKEDDTRPLDHKCGDALSPGRMMFIVIGAPYSGKSTYIKEKLLVGVDPAETEVFDFKELKTMGRVLRYCKAAVFERKDKIVIEGHLPRTRDRRKLIEFAYDNGYLPKAILINTSLLVCLDRNEDRKERDPKSALSDREIRKSIEQIEYPGYYEGFTQVLEVKFREEGEGDRG